MPAVSLSHPTQQLRSGDHACFIYQSDAEHDSMLSSFVAEGAARHEKVLYLYCDHNPEGLLRSLRTAGVRGGSERVLLIDDEQSVLHLTVKLLERLGYAVTARTNGREALDLFRQDPDQFDLVITDLSMPEIDGDRLAADLIKLRADIPVILYTGYVKEDCADEAARIGVKAILNKPFSAADLAKTVKSVLEAKQGGPK